MLKCLRLQLRHQCRESGVQELSLLGDLSRQMPLLLFLIEDTTSHAIMSLPLELETLKSRGCVLEYPVPLLGEYRPFFVAQETFQRIEVLKVQHTLAHISVLLIYDVFVKDLVPRSILTMDCLALSLLADFGESLSISLILSLHLDC